MVELKRQEKTRKEKEERDRMYEDSSKVWQNWIIPNWSKAYGSNRCQLTIAFVIHELEIYGGMEFHRHDGE